MLHKEQRKQAPGQITLTSISAEEMPRAIDVLVRGMRDNPVHIAALGDNTERRQRRLALLFGAAANARGWGQQMRAARGDNGAIVGICALALPGQCQPSTWQRLKLLPALAGLGPRSLGRVLQWLGAWAQQDPAAPHWHLGPLAVDAGRQGQGIGSHLMAEACSRADVAEAAIWLETDKAINVRFYQRFDFETVVEKTVLGLPCWYMMRRPREPEVRSARP